VKDCDVYSADETLVWAAELHPENYIKDPWSRLGLTGYMSNMSAVLRIKAELALVEASRKLLSQHASVRTSPETRNYADTVSVVRKELDKLVGILADDTSEKHSNVAARVAKCADYLAQIPSREVQDARLDMIAAHKVLQDIQEITF
jgi:response regulator RpfG family c-di-GMP phosphodiesterase